MNFRTLGLMLSLSLATATLAQTPKGDDSGDAGRQMARYDGHKLVRVQIRNQRDVMAMAQISGDTWSESVGVGPVDYRVAPEDMAALDALGANYQVLIDDIQTLIDAQRTSLMRPEGWQAPTDSTWFDDYHTYSDISSYVDTLVAVRPDLASRFSVGSSLQGREIFGIKITNPGGVADKPAVFLNGCQHAREWISPAVCMFIADELIRNEASDSEIASLLERVEIYIVPVSNPDGYEYTWTNDRLWRKNRRGNYGVDLNRNWSVGWGGEGSSGNQGSEVYRGTAPFSEPESAALSSYIESLGNVVTGIDIHSYSQLILEPWGYKQSAPPDAPEFSLIGDTMADEIFDVHGKRYQAGRTYTILYPASGVTLDWLYGELGAFGLSIELRDTGSYGFLLPKTQIRPNGQEIVPAIMYLAEYFAPDIDLEVTNLVAGQNATLSASNCVPAGSVTFYYSLTGLDHTFLSSARTYVDLANPVLIGTANANGSGVATLVRRVPVGARNRLIYAQAIQTGENSNVFSGRVQ